MLVEYDFGAESFPGTHLLAASQRQRVPNAGIWTFEVPVHAAWRKLFGERDARRCSAAHSGAGPIACRCAPREQPAVSGWEAGAAVGLLGVRRVEGVPYRSPAAANAWVGVPGVSAPVCFS